MSKKDPYKYEYINLRGLNTCDGPIAIALGPDCIILNNFVDLQIQESITDIPIYRNKEKQINKAIEVIVTFEIPVVDPRILGFNFNAGNQIRIVQSDTGRVIHKLNIYNTRTDFQSRGYRRMFIDTRSYTPMDTYYSRTDLKEETANMIAIEKQNQQKLNNLNDNDKTLKKLAEQYAEQDSIGMIATLVPEKSNGNIDTNMQVFKVDEKGKMTSLARDKYGPSQINRIVDSKIGEPVLIKPQPFNILDELEMEAGKQLQRLTIPKVLIGDDKSVNRQVLEERRNLLESNMVMDRYYPITYQGKKYKTMEDVSTDTGISVDQLWAFFERMVSYSLKEEPSTKKESIELPEDERKFNF
jgi:hypothetical protein